MNLKLSSFLSLSTDKLIQIGENKEKKKKKKEIKITWERVSGLGRTGGGLRAWDGTVVTVGIMTEVSQNEGPLGWRRICWKRRGREMDKKEWEQVWSLFEVGLRPVVCLTSPLKLLLLLLWLLSFWQLAIPKNNFLKLWLLKERNRQGGLKENAPNFFEVT